ncbi:MAG: glycosyltransferase family 4 protein [Legionellaceae bacterium]|nr:glycosyltransferase family 4 protein [Legionellaceae bacterium]
MKILYLYAEVMGYTMAIIKALVERGVEAHVVHWDHKKLTTYQAPECSNVYMYKRSEMSIDAMRDFAQALAPTITVVAGWMDKGYMKVIRQLRAQGKVVVTGFDAQWCGSMRQYAAAVFGALDYFSHYYSHAWVSGAYQYEYARRLGFDKKEIIYDLLSADLNLFHDAYQGCIEKKAKCYPHRFLFVGRFEPVKGLDTLLKAWQLLGKGRCDWELHLIGNGSLKTTLQATQGVVVKDFMQPELLKKEVAHAGCFLLPSTNEPWGVVVHEFAAAGIPLILSDVVGARSTFLISGLNGYLFKANDAQALANRMRQICELSDQKLMTMAEASHQLSYRISPQTSAANLLSLIDTL